MSRFHLTWDKGVGLFLIFTILLGTFSSEYFATTSNLTFIIRDVAEIAIIALAMAYLIIAGEIDLSVASMLSLSSATIGFLYRAEVPFEMAMLGGLLAGLLAGLFNGFLVTVLGLPSLAVTIATLALYRGMCWILLGNKPVNQLPSEWVNLGYSQIPGTFLPWTVIPLVVLAAASWFVLHGTRFGRWVFAIGVNPQAAEFSGIPVRKVKLLLFAFTGFTSGVAGVIYTLRFASASPDGAVGYELGVIAAVLFGGVSIAGGVGTLWGVIAAVLSLGVIRSALQLVDFSANALLVVSGGLLLISVISPKVTDYVRSQRSKASTTKLTRRNERVKP
jgi:rhamnose transport system permease protein